MMHYIVTFMPYFKKIVIKELKKIDENLNIITEFTPEIILIETSKTQKDFTNDLLESNPIFIKHIAPASKIIPSLKTKDEVKKLLPNIVEELVSIDKRTLFSVQTRIVVGKSFGLDYNSKDIEVILGEHFCEDEKRGEPFFSDKELLNNDDVNIISVFITPQNTYLGFSKAKENLNFHDNEARICSHKGKREVSRAENKLKEAISKFSLKLEGGKALDIGAAPGGWTKVLVDNGYFVIAVDPAELFDNVKCLKEVTHLKSKIEDLKFENEFDIIVNDMNMEPADSARVMVNLHKSLKENAKCVLTVKLPFNPEKGILEAKEVLKDYYEILNIKNLFHNRQEVTMLLKKKDV